MLLAAFALLHAPLYSFTLPSSNPRSKLNDAARAEVAALNVSARVDAARFAGRELFAAPACRLHERAIRVAL